MSNKITVVEDEFGFVNNPPSSEKKESVKRFTFSNGDDGVSIQVKFFQYFNVIVIST